MPRLKGRGQKAAVHERSKAQRQADAAQVALERETGHGHSSSSQAATGSASRERFAGSDPDLPVAVKVEAKEEDPDLCCAGPSSSASALAPPRARSSRSGQNRRTVTGRTAASGASSSNHSTTSTPPPPLTRNFPWPEHFVNLEKVFKAVSTVHVFCNARKHLATTFDTIRSGVEGLLKRPLDVFEIAQIKSLVPNLITFAYVDENNLPLHVDDHPSEQARARTQYKDDLFEEAALRLDEGAQGALRKGKERERDSQRVLLLDFNDGELHSVKAPARSKRARAIQRKQGATDPKKTASQASMQKLIEKRHFKFEQAVLELLTACRAKGEDPVQLVIDAANEHIPVDHDFDPLGRDGETPRKKRIKLEHLMAHPDERPMMADIIEEMKTEEWWNDQIVENGHRVFEAREAQYGDLEFQLSQELVDALYATRRIDKFYAHQAEALNHLHFGSNVIVSTSTSSGKSLIVPVLQALQADPASTAIYIFPTKALAQDQKRSLQDLLRNCEGLEDVVVATYDGDTPQQERKVIRERASVIFTNPDMLHVSVLPSEDLWRRFLRNLKYIVVDELHIYNGLFGAHVSYIMRRLRRICCALGNRKVKFISCSATVANPEKHMETVFGVEDVKLVNVDGSPAGRKEWVIWNPPYIDPDDRNQGRVSTFQEVSRVFRYLVERGARTIVFCKIRRVCEIVMKQVRTDLVVEGRDDIVPKVMSYRSGYSPQDRRRIEQDMFSGRLLGIIATSALELGIDIGSLDAVIMLGFPYSISSMRQQAGRAGRRQKDSLALLMGDPFPLDQHYMRNPDEIFTSPDADLGVDLENEFVLEAHLQCAAEEMPVHPKDDVPFFGPRLPELCEKCLVVDEAEFYHCHPRMRPDPARKVAIRGARQETYSVVDDTPNVPGNPKVLEEIELERAIFEVYEGAVFMHQGITYLAMEMNHDRRMATVVQKDVNYITRSRDFTDVDPMETYRMRSLRSSSCRAFYGRIVVSTVVFGYFKTDRRANILDVVDVDMPPFVRDTHGLWLDLPKSVIDGLIDKEINVAAAIHAAEHALLGLTPLFVMSVQGDVRTECKAPEKEYGSRQTTRKRPARLTLYDATSQNGGICAKAFDHLDSMLRTAILVIEKCACEDGCPSCVSSQACSEGNLVTSKVGGLAVLRAFVGRDLFDADVMPQHESGHGVTRTQAGSLTETIVPATPVRLVRPNMEVEVVVERLPKSFVKDRPRQPTPLLPSIVGGSDPRDVNFVYGDDVQDVSQVQRPMTVEERARAKERRLFLEDEDEEDVEGVVVKDEEERGMAAEA